MADPMNSTPPVVQFVQGLLAREQASAVPAPGGGFAPGVAACEKLRQPLTQLIGAGGFASLLSRALALAKRQSPVLAPLRVQADGALTGFGEVPHDAASADAAREGAVALVAEFLGLLITFIGQPLTLTLVRQAWPDAPAAPFAPPNEETP